MYVLYKDLCVYGHHREKAKNQSKVDDCDDVALPGSVFASCLSGRGLMDRGARTKAQQQAFADYRSSPFFGPALGV